MKFCLILMGLLSVTTSFALNNDDTPLGAKIQYESWCENDVIKSEDKHGDMYVVFDCYDADRRCDERAKKVGDWTIISATCVE